MVDQRPDLEDPVDTKVRPAFCSRQIGQVGFASTSSADTPPGRSARAGGMGEERPQTLRMNRVTSASSTGSSRPLEPTWTKALSLGFLSLFLKEELS